MTLTSPAIGSGVYQPPARVSSPVRTAASANRSTNRAGRAPGHDYRLRPAKKAATQVEDRDQTSAPSNADTEVENHAAPRFSNWLNLLLGLNTRKADDNTGEDNPSTPAIQIGADPSQIAEALMRSMQVDRNLSSSGMAGAPAALDSGTRELLRELQQQNLKRDVPEAALVAQMANPTPLIPGSDLLTDTSSHSGPNGASAQAGAQMGDTVLSTGAQTAGSASGLAFSALLTPREAGTAANSGGGSSGNVSPAPSEKTPSLLTEAMTGANANSREPSQQESADSDQLSSGSQNQQQIAGKAKLDATAGSAPEEKRSDEDHLFPALGLPTVSGAPSQRAAAPGSSVPSTAAPELEAPTATLVPRIHEMVVQVNPPEQSPVDLQVTQRQGQVHVVVRTDDQELRSTLRENLPSLVTSLDRAGFHAQTFSDRVSQVTAAQNSAWNHEQDANGTFHQNGFSGGGDSSRQQGQGSQNRNPRERMEQMWFTQTEE